MTVQFMKAMILRQLGPISSGTRPLEYVELPRPVPAANEILIRISTCGVCHTELDEIEGRTAPPRLPVIPGHQIVGTVVETGSAVVRHQSGDRVGVGWIYSSDGSETENLSPRFLATGRDVNGGYAEYMTIGEDYAWSIPDVFTDQQAAPLLCAGSIGFRALRLTHLKNGDPLGLTGFGGSGHLVLQLARHLYPDSPVFVFARDDLAQRFARDLGAVWSGDTGDRCPQKLAAIIDTTPAWKPVVEALANLAPGGRLVINAIRKESGDKQTLLELDYHEHLWKEREIKTVANITAADIAEFLPLAAEIPIRPRTEVYSLESANRALIDLKLGPVQGAKVLQIYPPR